MSNVPKKHHFLPEFYLRGFCRDSSLWTYDLEKDQYDPRRPEIFGIKKHFYSITDSEGKRDPHVEKQLAKVEGRVAPVFRRLDEAPDRSLSRQETKDLALFAAFMKFRVLEFHNWLEGFAETIFKERAKTEVQTVEAVRQQLESMEGITSSDLEHAEEIFRRVQEGEYGIELNPDYRVTEMVEQANQFAEVLFQSNWALIKAPENSSFAVSDNPLVNFYPRSVRHLVEEQTQGFNLDRMEDPYSLSSQGITSRHMVKCLPLSQHLCLLMGSNKGLFKKTHTADRQQVREINENIARFAVRFLVARDESLLRRLTRSIPDRA